MSALPPAAKLAFEAEVARLTTDAEAALADLRASARADADRFLAAAKELAKDYAQGTITEAQGRSALDSLKLGLHSTLVTQGYSVKAETVRMLGEALRSLMTVAAAAL